jgi:hypothetical protein
MRATWRIPAAAIVVLFVGAWVVFHFWSSGPAVFLATARLPEDPDELILYLIDGPSFYKSGEELTPEMKKGEVFHGYPVLGRVEIADPVRVEQ